MVGADQVLARGPSSSTLDVRVTLGRNPHLLVLFVAVPVYSDPLRNRRATAHVGVVSSWPSGP